MAAPYHRVNLHMKSGNIISFNTVKFSYDSIGSQVTEMTWDRGHVPDAVFSQSLRPPHFVDLTQIEAIQTEMYHRPQETRG